MSAFKQSKTGQSPMPRAAANSNGLTQQELSALRLAWSLDEPQSAQSLNTDKATEHCAELGYN